MSVVGQDQPSFVSLMARIAHMELAVAQFVGVPVPQIREDLVDGVQAAPQELNPNRSGEQLGAVPVPQIKEDDVVTTKEQTGCAPPLTLDQPGDQARPDSTDAVFRQGDHARRDSAVSRLST